MPKKKEERPRRQRWTPEEASVVLAKQTASGLSVQQFAAREGLDAERLYRWRRRLETAPGPGPAFVEVQPSRRPRIEIVLPSGHVLFVPDSVDEGALGRLLGVLERSEEC